MTEEQRQRKSVRVKPSIWDRARIGAIARRKTLGAYLEWLIEQDEAAVRKELRGRRRRR